MQEVIAKAIGARLAELRESAGWSMSELGRRSGTRVAQVSRHEHGLVSPPLYVLARYARAYGISVAAIVHAADLELAKRREEGELQ